MLAPFMKEGRLEAGCDEAGRGCLAGPVVAASVILPETFFDPLLNDSKQVNKKNRNYLRDKIENEALAWAVAFIDHKEIDRINILNASIKGMHNAVGQLKLKPEFLLIDGNRFKKYPGLPHQCVVKGDAKFASIAAASILAKTHRDEFMTQLHNQFPYYAWNKNKAYATLTHRMAIEEYGFSPYHRKTFVLKSLQTEIVLK